MTTNITAQHPIRIPIPIPHNLFALQLNRSVDVVAQKVAETLTALSDCLSPCLSPFLRLTHFPKEYKGVHGRRGRRDVDSAF